LPEVAGVVVLILIADFVAPLVTVALTLAAIFNSIGAILGHILPSSSRPASVCPSKASGSAYGRTAGNPRRELLPTALQKIGCCTTCSRRTRSADCAGCGSRSINEFI